LNFEYGCKAAIFLFFHQSKKNTIVGNFKAFRKNIGVVGYYAILPAVLWQVHQDLMVGRRDFLQLGREHPTHAL
jgi:hypothetical protein